MVKYYHDAFDNWSEIIVSSIGNERPAKQTGMEYRRVWIQIVEFVS